MVVRLVQRGTVDVTAFEVPVDDETGADVPDDLQRLLDAARASGPEHRLPLYRDGIAAFGADAIEPLVAWIQQPTLAAFAIRTIERIAELVPQAKPNVIVELAWLDRDGLGDAITADIEASLGRLGVDLKRATRGRTSFDKRARTADEDPHGLHD